MSTGGGGFVSSAPATGRGSHRPSTSSHWSRRHRVPSPRTTTCSASASAAQQKITNRVSRYASSPSPGATNPTSRTGTPSSERLGSWSARMTNSVMIIGTAPRTGGARGGNIPSEPPGTAGRLDAAYDPRAAGWTSTTTSTGTSSSRPTRVLPYPWPSPSPRPDDRRWSNPSGGSSPSSIRTTAPASTYGTSEGLT